MTKRRYNEDLPEGPPKRGGPGPFTMALALMFGAAMALTADSHADPRSAYAQVTKSITKTLQTWTMDQHGYASLRIGDWPSQLLTLADVTLSAKELGYAPKVTMQEGMRRFADWWRGATRWSAIARGSRMRCIRSSMPI